MSDIWVEVSIESQPWKCTRVETQPGWTVGDIVKAAKVNLKIIDGDGFYGIRAEDKDVALSLPVRVSGLYTSQRVTMYRVNAGSVKVRLSLLAGDRAEFSSSFDCGATIWDIMSSFDELKRYYNSSGPVLHPLVHIDRYSSYANLMENDPNQKFTCLIMGKVLNSISQLKHTTLKELNHVSGSLGIRLIIETGNTKKSKIANTKGTESTKKVKSVSDGKCIHQEEDQNKHPRNVDTRPKKPTIQELEMMLSLQPEDRGIKLFRIRPHTDTEKSGEYSDNFYDITAKDVKVLHEQKKITDRIVWSNLFLNEEAKRQKLLQSKLQEPNITIRVRLDNMVILQANFKILEPVSRLYDLTREYTAEREGSDFKLMLPPNTILNKDKTLFDSGIRSDTIVVFCGTPLSLRPEYCDCVVEYESKINYLPPDNSCTMENAHQSSGDNSPGSPSTERKASGPKKKKELPNFFKAIKK